MYEITDIPVKDPNGKRIGKAKVRVEDDGDVIAMVELTNDRGRMLAEGLRQGLIDGFSFGPAITPALAPLRD